MKEPGDVGIVFSSLRISPVGTGGRGVFFDCSGLRSKDEMIIMSIYIQQ